MNDSCHVESASSKSLYLLVQVKGLMSQSSSCLLFPSVQQQRNGWHDGLSTQKPRLKITTTRNMKTCHKVKILHTNHHLQ